MRVVKTAEERKNEILDVAEELFSSYGFEETSTNDIIARIGIARGTLYHHFQSKEEILDAVIERLTTRIIAKAAVIIHDKRRPLVDRLVDGILALNVDSNLGHEVMAQVHKPQNALLHQKMQEQLISGVVPLLAELFEEGCEVGVFSTPYPREAAEMIIVYSNIAFDELNLLEAEAQKNRIQGFIFHTQRILGVNDNSLEEAILKIFAKNLGQ